MATEGAVDAFEIALGDCLQQPGGATEELIEVSSVTAVPCSEPHDGEVYAAFDLPAGAYPGDAEVASAGEDRCLADFATFVGTAYEDSTYDITSLFPTEESWTDQENREYLCIVVAPEGETVTGTLKDVKA